MTDKNSNIEKVLKHINQSLIENNEQQKDHKKEVASQLMSMGNIAAGSLLFGQAVSGLPFKINLAILGLTVVALLYSFAFLLLKGGPHEH